MSNIHRLSIVLLPLLAACAGTSPSSPTFLDGPLNSSSYATNGSKSLTINFDPRSHEVAVQGVIDGGAWTFLIDTAVDPSAVDHALAKAHDLRPVGESGELEGVGSSVATAYPSILDKIMIGGSQFGPIDVVVMDMSKLSAQYGAPLAGILGYSLLKDHAILIDYPATQITFFDREAVWEPKNCAANYRFPIEFLSEEERMIVVPALAIGGVEIPAFIDTGSSNGLRIDLDAPAVAHLLSSLPPGEQSTAVGARGEAAQRLASLPVPVTLGDLSLNNADVAMVHGGSMPIGIGNRFFEALKATLLVDIPSGKIAIFQDCKPNQ